MFNIKFFTSIEQIGQQVWDALATEVSPFCQYHFLHALETSGSVGQNSGWQPRHLVIYENSIAVGVLPLYQKTHSYGEYVFDFAWANTYKQYGVSYYPKLVSAIPFTPVTGSRLMLAKGIELDEILPSICKKIEQELIQQNLSSMHWLFLEKSLSDKLTHYKQLSRHSVQFQWFNRNYQNFDDYLSHFNSRKRKNIKKERNNIISKDITHIRLYGDALTKEHMQFFYQCYQQTYLKRSGHTGYLTEAFFQQIHTDMLKNLMLVIASKNEQPIASALFLFDKNQLCGRYWGTLEDIDNLHFEACYYQGIEFCIENNISQFNPGTQGEHKILRGFEPIYCYSNHSLKEMAFHDGVSRFIDEEKKLLAKYKADAEKLLPFKKI
ncbi:GNAT family N-acetyltransferase [Paraglaciecola sp. L3A3]|uniref:GNAT family N-acetyltransferase n=1 Tax=Paraglaciecola sp. L3A3 TaxID=2686358 RepID=UPI00131E713E|nr:GNAT family N-acetyltransferase [Paraglaciecola sp. L3A3]